MDNAYLVNITINNTENVTFANHNGSKIEGNWINLSGGTPVTLPGLTFIYHGVNVTNYNQDGSYINITVNVHNYTDYNFTYPYSTHPMYINTSNKNVVNITFNGSSYFANETVDIYLVSATLTQVKNVYNNITNGNTTPFRDLLSGAYNKSLNQSLDSSGDYNMSFDPLDAGDYAIFVLLNSSSPLLANPSDLSILSATAFQVLEYESELTAPSSAETDSLVSVSMSLTNAGSGNYTYGAVLIHEDAYEATLRLAFNGSRAGTNLTADGVYLIQEFQMVSGIGLSNVDRDTVINITEEIIGTNNGTVHIETEQNSTSFTLTTNDLNEGNYYLLIGVYKSGERLVAFNQTTITISKPTPQPRSRGGGGGGGGGGGTSGEAYENIICSETDRQFVVKDQEVGYSFKRDCNYVKHINFTGLSSSGKVAAKVEILNHTSSLVNKEAPDIVFKNLNVWIGNMGWFSDSNVNDPTITFMVDRSWVRNNNIILNTISFYSYNDHTSAWEKMSTRKIDEDGTSYYFKASLPIRGSLGPMAISGRTVMSYPTPVISPTLTAQPTPEITPTATPPTTWTGLWKEKIPGFQILMAMIVLIVLYLGGRRRNND